MRQAHAVLELLAPAVLVVAVALFGTIVSTSTETYVVTTLINVTIVVALYLFIGNSGVLSFGHVSFVAVGAWTAGILSMSTSEKPAIMPSLAGFLRDTTVGNVPSLALAAAVGALYALIIGLPLMRLSGLAAGIATFGVLEITHNVLRYWEKIGPGLNTFSAVPETTGLLQAALGLAGGLYVHLLPVNTEVLYLDLTFITLAMLVIGGLTSLWGAVVGAVVVSAVDSFLAEAENGVHVPGGMLDLPSGTRIVVVGTLMAVVLILRPSGLTGGRELRLPRTLVRGVLTKFSA